MFEASKVCWEGFHSLSGGFGEYPQDVWRVLVSYLEVPLRIIGIAAGYFRWFPQRVPRVPEYVFEDPHEPTPDWKVGGTSRTSQVRSKNVISIVFFQLCRLFW